jgi:hypothetical protein
MSAYPRIFLSALAILLGSAVAQAQDPARPIQLPLQIKPLPIHVAAGTWGFGYTSINGLRDGGDSANSPNLPRVCALRGFAFTFNNGDHEIRDIRLLADGQFTHSAFADQNGDDPYRFNATYTTFTNGYVGEASATGGGKFDIPLGHKPFPAGAYTLVLRGFEFRRADGTDANVRNIGIKLDGARNIAEVSLIDDQGADLRALWNTLGAIAVAGASGLPGVIETTTVVEHENDNSFGVNTLQGDAPGMVGQYRGYKVLVQYAWIPSALVKGTHPLSGTSHQAPHVVAPIDALQGFEFTFNNSDHHLLSLGVNGNAGNNDVFFSDNNRDDPLQWTVSYVTLDRSVLSPADIGGMLRLYQQAKQAH